MQSLRMLYVKYVVNQLDYLKPLLFKKLTKKLTKKLDLYYGFIKFV